MTAVKNRNMNRLDRINSDCLLHILSFCEDHIQFDMKRKVIFHREFQSKLKDRFLELEYGERDEADLDTADEELFKMRCIALELNHYPAGSFSIHYHNEDEVFKVIGNFRNPIFKEGNPKQENLVKYNAIDINRQFDFKKTEDLDEVVRMRIVDDNEILYITSGVIHNNLYKKQRNITIDDIEELQKNEMENVLKAICNLDGVIEDIIRYDGYANTLGFFICENIGEDVWMVEQEF